MIVITAFEAVPGAGTEAGLAWNWGQAYVAAGYEVTVLTSAGRAVDEHATEWRERGINVVFLGDLVDARAPQSPMELIRVAWRINKWIAACRRWLEQNSNSVEVIHHVSWGSVRLRPPFLKTDPSRMTVWGPLGGGQLAKFPGLLPQNLLHELLRAASFPIGWAKRRVDFLLQGNPTLSLATNSETLAFIRSLGIRSAESLLADGIQPERILENGPKKLGNEIKLVWLGRMVASKRADIAIQLLANLRSRDLPAHLTLIGDGPQRAELEEKAETLGVIKAVDFVGRVPWEETFKYYDQNDFLVFTSMRDSSCPAVLEAAARGLPTLCLRHQGVAAMVPESVAFGPEKFVSAARLADQLGDLVRGFREEPALYSQASREATVYARTQTWARKVDFVFDRLKGGVKS